MKYLFYYIFILLIISCQKNTTIVTETIDEIVNVKEKEFKGVIIPKEKALLFNKGKRFTPTISEIELAEAILTNQIKKLNQDKVNQVGGCPIIHRNLSKYYRQYVSYYNDENEKIIYINMIHKAFIKKSELSNELVIFKDGCSYFWNVDVNLSKEKLFDLYVNGVG